MDNHRSPIQVISSVDELGLAAETTVKEKYEGDIKSIRNDFEQISEINQSLSIVSHDIVEELTKILQLNGRVIRLENFDEDTEVDVYPKGLVIIRREKKIEAPAIVNEEVEPRPLADLEPPFLYAILRHLIPKLKESLDDRKRYGEKLLDELTRTRETLV